MNKEKPLWLRHQNMVNEIRADDVSYALKKGSDPNEVYEDGNTPLMLAAESNKVSAMRVLLELGRSHGNFRFQDWYARFLEPQ